MAHGDDHVGGRPPRRSVSDSRLWEQGIKAIIGHDHGHDHVDCSDQDTNAGATPPISSRYSHARTYSGESHGGHSASSGHAGIDAVAVAGRLHGTRVDSVPTSCAGSPMVGPAAPPRAITPASLVADVGSPLSRPAEDVGVAHPMAAALCSPPAAMSSFEREQLVAENARLASENALLRQKCMMATLDTSQPVSCPAGQHHVGQQHAGQQHAGQHHAGQHHAAQHHAGQHQGQHHAPWANAAANADSQAPIWWFPIACMPNNNVGSGWCTAPATTPHCGGGALASPCREHTTPQLDIMAPVAEHPGQPSTRAKSGATLAAKGRQTSGGAEDSDPAPDVPIEERSTVMLRNLPNNYTRRMVLDMLDSEGYDGKYDFIYLPMDFKTQACLGYAFVNLVSPSLVAGFWQTFDGYSKWTIPSKKVGYVSWCGPHQGYEAHVERYRNSPVMHPTVPDEYRPLVFRDGVCVPFPPPTKNPRAPRIRNFMRRHPPSGAGAASTQRAA